MKKVFTLVCLSLLGITLPTAPTLGKDAEGHRLGLVLSGGAARGLSHIGVLRALEEHNIEIDYIAGTSMGAIIGAMYASGYSVDQIEAIALGINWSNALTDLPPRDNLTFRRKLDHRRNLLTSKITITDGELKLPAGMVDGQNLALLLQDIFSHTNSIQNFDQLSIPFRAISTNLETGEQVVFGGGDLNKAVRASMSIPGLLSPVRDGDLVLADGGMANNLPIDVVKSMGAERVIAVNIGAPLEKAEELTNVLAITEQVTTFLTLKNVAAQLTLLNENDLLIEPSLLDLGSVDFSRAREAVDLGYQGSNLHTVVLRTFSRAENLTVNEAVDRPAIGKPTTIRSVQIDNHSYFSDETLLGFIDQKSGKVFRKKQLLKNINTLYGLEYFDSVSYRLLEPLDPSDNGERILEIAVHGKPRNTSYARFGINTSDTFGGSNYYNLGFSFNRTGVNKLGAEWLSQVQFGNDIYLASELYLPLGLRTPLYLRPEVSFEASDIPVYANDLQTEILLLRDTRWRGGLFGGYEFNHNTDISIGVAATQGSIELQTGSVGFESIDYSRSYAEARFRLDTEDNIYFPTSGSNFDIAYRDYDIGFGNSESYREANIFASRTWSYQHHALTLRTSAARTDGNNSIPSRRFYLGGLGRLSGMPQKSLVTQNNDLVTLSYTHLLNRALLVFDTRYYLIATLEYGRAWNDENNIYQFDTGYLKAGSISLAMDSAIGPIMLGYGQNSANRHALYLSIGQSL